MATDEMKSLEKWSHLYPIILRAGRCTHAEPEGINEEEKEEFMNKLAEDDPTVDRFKVIAEDVPVPGDKGAWLSKVCGDIQQYNKIGGEGTTSYAINVIKSLRWPGSYTIAKGGKYCNVYIGDGIKRGDDTFIPTSPPDVMTDPSEQLEQPEPQGVEAVAKEEKPEGDGEEQE